MKRKGEKNFRGERPYHRRETWKIEFSGPRWAILETDQQREIIPTEEAKPPRSPLKIPERELYYHVRGRGQGGEIHRPPRKRGKDESKTIAILAPLEAREGFDPLQGEKGTFHGVAEKREHTKKGLGRSKKLNSQGPSPSLKKGTRKKNVGFPKKRGIERGKRKADQGPMFGIALVDAPPRKEKKRERGVVRPPKEHSPKPPLSSWEGQGDHKGGPLEKVLGDGEEKRALHPRGALSPSRRRASSRPQVETRKDQALSSSVGKEWDDREHRVSIEKRETP